MQRSLVGRHAAPRGYDWAKVPLSSWIIDPDFDADNEDFIASLIVDVAHGHTVSVSELPHTFPTAAGKSAIPLLHKHATDPHGS